MANVVVELWAEGVDPVGGDADELRREAEFDEAREARPRQVAFRTRTIATIVFQFRVVARPP